MFLIFPGFHRLFGSLDVGENFSKIGDYMYKNLRTLYGFVD